MDLRKRITTAVLLCAVMASAQSGKYLQVSVEGLSGAQDVVSGSYPAMAGVGKNIKPAIDVSSATSLAVKVKAVSDTPIAGDQSVQARIYVKTDTVDYVWAAPEGGNAFTDLTLDSWVEIDVPLGEFMQSSGTPVWTELTQIGLQLSTYGGLVFTGSIQIDDVVATTGGDPVVISDFEDIAHGWKEQDVGGTVGSVIAGVTVPGGPNLTPEGGGMKLTLEGLDGAEVDGTWPNQTAVGKVLVPVDISSVNTVGIMLYPGQDIPEGSALQARIYVKTGADWTWSTSSSFTDLKGKKWNTVAVNTGDLVQETGEAMADPTQVREVGIQFFTWNLTYSGIVYIDNLFVDDETLFGFEDVLGWQEVDVGQTEGVVLQSIEHVEDVASLTDVGVRFHCAGNPAGYASAVRINATVGDQLTVRYRTTGPGRVSAGLYSLDGALAATLFSTTAPGAVDEMWSGKVRRGAGAYCVRVTGPGLRAVRMLKTVR